MSGEKISNLLNRKKEYSPQLVLVILWSLLVVLGGLITLVMLFRTPSDLNNIFLLGLSKVRFVILVGVLGVLISFGFLISYLWRNPEKGNKLSTPIYNWIQKTWLNVLLVAFSIGGVIICSQLLNLANIVSDPYVQGYLLRLKPLLFWALVLCLQTLITLPLLRYGVPKLKKIIQGKILCFWGVIFIFLVLLSIGIMITGIGLEPDKIGWDAPGVPILPLQVGFVWVVGVIFFVFETVLAGKKFTQTGLWFDLLIISFLWLTAFVLWNQEPLTPAFFVPEPRAPNFEYYPHSDAALHDGIAQSLLIGEGFPGVARKPLYAMFLALLHVVAGQNYLDVITLQVAVLGLFPVFLYLVAKGLHNRLSGVIAAGLIILREQNAIALSGEIGVSHAKMMMSDLPAAVAVAMITWLIIRWLQEPSKRRLSPVGIGGCLGLLLLIRPQSTLLIPALFVLVVIVFHKRPLWGWGNAGLVTLGLFLTLFPWLWRSYQLTGKYALNDPSQTAFLTQQYRITPGTDILPRVPNETEAGYIQRVKDYLKDFILQNPGIVAGFVTSHFAHNEIQMMQALPVSFWLTQNPDSDLFPQWKTKWSKMWDECCSLSTYINAVGFWDPIRKDIRTPQFVPMALNLILISIGLSVVWLRQDITGWIPLGMSLVYSLSTAVGRYSGWRLILPADWVIYLYFAIGIGQVTLWLHAFYTGQGGYEFKTDIEKSWQRIKAISFNVKFPTAAGIFLSIGLLSLGLIPLGIEAAVPQRYPHVPREDLLDSVALFEEDEIRNLLDSDGAVVLQGRALYPRFYKAGEGEPGDEWPAFNERNFARIGFVLLYGSQRTNVIMPMNGPPEVFPHASDVIVVGCKDDDYVDAAVISISTGQMVSIVGPSSSGMSCQLPSPQVK